MLAANFAQSGGALAVSFKTKDPKLKQIAMSGGISALFGITEPALYGVHLKLKKTLLACMIGAGVSGIFVGLIKLKAFVMVSPGIATMPIFIEKGLQTLRLPLLVQSFQRSLRLLLFTSSALKMQKLKTSRRKMSLFPHQKAQEIVKSFIHQLKETSFL